MDRTTAPARWLNRIVAAALLLATAPAAAQQGDPYAEAMRLHTPLAKVAGAPQPIAPATAEDARFAKAIDYARATQSYALLIWQGGRLRVEKYFPPYDATLRSESASMHKSVLGLVTAAIADGKIASVDDRVGTYIPEWAHDPRGDITVRQVLTMSTGLTPPPGTDFLSNGAHARAAVLAMARATAPGTGFQYANAVSQILVLVLEKATGMSYADYLSQRLWTRLHADDAYVWLNEPTGFPRGYTGLMAHPVDWLRVGLLIKNRGRVGRDQVIPARLIAQETAPSSTNPNYGWQIWRGATWQAQRFYNDAKVGASVTASAPFLAPDMLYFDGFGGQRVYVSRAKDLVIVRLGALRLDWDDAMLPNLTIAALQ